MRPVTVARIYLLLTVPLSVGATTDLLNGVPPWAVIALLAAALACAASLGLQRRAGQCLGRGLWGLVGWLVVADLAGLDDRFEETPFLNGVVLVAVLYLVALIGAATAWARARREPR